MDELLKDIAKKLKAGEKGEKDKDKGELQQENNDPVLPRPQGRSSSLQQAARCS